MVVCALGLPLTVFAQADDDQGLSEVIEEVVVTGTAGGAEIRKFDASFAITSVDDADIAQYSPQSTADLLKLVPGSGPKPRVVCRGRTSWCAASRAAATRRISPFR